MISTKIDSFSRTLDSVIIKKINTKLVNTDADTLAIPKNTFAVFKISGLVSEPVSKDIGFYEKTIVIKNLNGTYSILSSITSALFQGQINVSSNLWSVLIVNNLPILRLSVPTGRPMNWQFFYTKSIKPL